MNASIAKRENSDHTAVRAKYGRPGIDGRLPATLPVSHSIPALQRKPHCACGGSCPRCQEDLPVQPKLKIGAPNDKYEKEADQVADQVMSMPDPTVQRQANEGEGEEEVEEEEPVQPKPIANTITPCVQRQAEPEEEEQEAEPERDEGEPESEREEEEESVQTKSLTNNPTTGAGLQNRIQSLKGGGQPLPKSERAFFEPRFGADFSNVRIHNDAQSARVARSVNARAFAVGRDVVFGAGQYYPGTHSGRNLLAHELTHVVQQRSTRKKISIPNMIQRYSASAAASYALKHARSPNKRYVFYSDDCTNFISQALYAGGWTMKTGRGYCKDLRSYNVWWYRKYGCPTGYGCISRDRCVYWRYKHNSHTWSVANFFWYFAKKSGRARAIKYFSQLRVGDVLQRSEPNSTHINHTMMVTKKRGKQFYLSYHTKNRKNKPFYDEGRTKGFRTLCPPPKYKYYGWNII